MQEQPDYKVIKNLVEERAFIEAIESIRKVTWKVKLNYNIPGFQVTPHIF